MHMQNVSLNPTTKAMRKGIYFQLRHLGNHLTYFDDTYFDPTTWVVWANAQFATARFLSLILRRIAVYCDRRSSVVSSCVCLLVTLVSREKTDELIESRDAVWG